MKKKTEEYGILNNDTIDLEFCCIFLFLDAKITFAISNLLRAYFQLFRFSIQTFRATILKHC